MNITMKQVEGGVCAAAQPGLAAGAAGGDHPHGSAGARPPGVRVDGPVWRCAAGHAALTVHATDSLSHQAGWQRKFQPMACWLDSAST